MPPELLKSDTAVVVKYCNGRLQADRLPELLFSSFVFVLLEEGDAEEIHRIGVFRLGFQDRPIGSFRFRNLPSDFGCRPTSCRRGAIAEEP